MLDDFEAYCKKTDALRERGVQVGDILICNEGARPIPHQHTGRPCVRVSEYCIIDGTGPRFFIHGFIVGLLRMFLISFKTMKWEMYPAWH